MNKQAIWIIIALALMFAAFFLHLPQKQPSVSMEDTLLYAADIEAALQEVDGSFVKQLVTVDTPTTYKDSLGNTIVYHCLRTVFFDADPHEVTALHRQAIEGLIESDILDTFEDCSVSGFSAVKGLANGRAYLCWTLSPEFSFVIEYSPDSVSEEDIFQMAESVIPSASVPDT